MLRKTPFFLLPIASLVFSSSVFANTEMVVPADNNFKVTVPTLRPGFSFSLAALALQPGASNLNYVIYNKELPAQSPTWVEKEIQPHYQAGFALGANYTFCDGKDIRLQWTHLNNRASTSIVAPNDNFFLGPDYQIGPPSLPIRSASGSAQFKYDVINLDAGQFVDFGSRVETRFFIGLSNAYLREQVNSNYSGNGIFGVGGPFFTKQKITANFTGLGPRIGMEGNFYLGKGFSLFGEGAISALLGDTYSKTAYVSSSPILKATFGQNINNQTIKDDDVTQVIPAFDAQLGASYKYTLCNGEALTVKAGYQAAVYVNAISQYTPDSLVTAMDSGGIFVNTMSHRLSNYSVQGFFLEGKFEI